MGGFSPALIFFGFFIFSPFIAILSVMYSLAKEEDKVTLYDIKLLIHCQLV